uniref:SAYSvFN domain-containing protein n=1 Tax=Parastrongyloides trichosuri TaxID=131310 RepID=A0A0N5A010_PARTI
MYKAKEQLEKFKKDHLKESPKEELFDDVTESRCSIGKEFWQYVVQEYKWYAYLGIFLFYLSGQFLFNYAGFGIVYMICFLMLLMYLNMGKRKEGEISAYSVFNENFESLPGQMNAGHFEESLLKRKIKT